MGLACSSDIYQEKMSELFIDMIFIIVYQDDIIVLTSIHLMTTYDNLEMFSNGSITTTFKSTLKNQASAHWRRNT
jgi:hypothetical protein